MATDAEVGYLEGICDVWKEHGRISRVTKTRAELNFSSNVEHSAGNLLALTSPFININSHTSLAQTLADPRNWTRDCHKPRSSFLQ